MQRYYLKIATFDHYPGGHLLIRGWTTSNEYAVITTKGKADFKFVPLHGKEHGACTWSND